MKRIVFLFLILLVVGCMSVFAQRGGGGARGGNAGGGNPSGNMGGRNDVRQDRNNQPRDNRSAAGERANRPENGERRPPGIAGTLRRLDLSDEQKQQIRDIQKAAKENGTDRRTVAEQIKAVLTPEQIEKLEKRKEKKKEKRENRQNSGDQPNN